MSNRFTADLKFVGLSEDGEHLIVEGPQGSAFRLRVTPMVRAAVRLDRPAMEHHKAEIDGSLPPREIQARIRSGMSAHEISQKTGVSLEHIARYEGPILAEREFIAERARTSPIASEPDSPTLGEIVTDRLATRGVNILDLEWDAFKSDGHGWLVSVSYIQDQEVLTAKWAFKQSSRTLNALDSEARSLSETQISDQPIPPRHLSAVRNAVFDFEAMPVTGSTPAVSASPSAGSPTRETEELVDRLNRMRGTRHTSGESQGSRSASVSPVPNNVFQFSSTSSESSPQAGPSVEGSASTGASVGSAGSARTPSAESSSDPVGRSGYGPTSGFGSSSHSAPTAISAHEPRDLVFDAPIDTRPPHTGLVPIISPRSPETGLHTAVSPAHPGPQFERPEYTNTETSAIARLMGRKNKAAGPATGALRTGTVPSVPAGSTPTGAVPTGVNPTTGEHRTTVDPRQEGAGDHDRQGGKKSKGRQRSPMPSWDEIMFGSKPE
jgi:hypothetical protein